MTDVMQENKTKNNEQPMKNKQNLRGYAILAI
jgi:hypothetical protein